MQSPLTQSDIDSMFSHHQMNPDQFSRAHAIRLAGHALAGTILKSVPPGADQSAAIRKVREAVMTANSAIACGE